MDWSLYPPKIHLLKPQPLSVTKFGDKGFMEVNKVKWGNKSGTLIQ